ncbi:TlpA family protein disulfide reductase [Flavobacteriaceae bacterium F08102]|nr:TlpA family protein disulfide reductase [Flavobacteriaceae bacterium F08102]
MNMNTLFVLGILLCFPVLSKAQSNFSISPSTPQPGQLITFTYTPPDGLVTDTAPLRCDAYKFGMYHDQMELSYFPVNIELIELTKKGNTYTGQVKSDVNTRFLSFTFSSGAMTYGYTKGGLGVLTGSLDTNHNQGYSTLFYDADGQDLPYSNVFGARYLERLGVNNNELFIEMYERELAINPSSKVAVLPGMIRVLNTMNPELAKKRAQLELEKVFNNGMNSEEDYLLAGALFRYLGLYVAEKYFLERGKELFPSSTGLFGIRRLQDKLTSETNPTIQKQLKDQIEKLYAAASPGYRIFVLNTHQIIYYKRNNTLTNNQKAEADFPFSFYGTMAWAGKIDPLIDKKDPTVLTLLNQHYAYTLTRWKSLKANRNQVPASSSEKYMTTTERWRDVNDRLAYLNYQYASYYNCVHEYKKAFRYAKKAFQLVEDGNFMFNRATKINDLYVSLIEKISPKNSKNILEKSIAGNRYTTAMTKKLKNIYIDQHKTEAGFKKYYRALIKSNNHFNKEIESLLIHKPAPKFSLLNVDGEEVTKESLKGKIVVLDFWATWCGPCIASFPAMAELKAYFSVNDDVEFVFVNTGERNFSSYDELNERISNFLIERALDFNVILDAQHSMASDFTVGNLPTKIIIDKQGNIRYKVVGYETDSQRLILEMNTMINSIK